ncbi:hypothetical protein [Henriciella sp.]|uniref:hypothetical protein n=1 Tax=Henriciella sp. TaxID=1968823 RepID=UPI00261B232E|nr:hypothetical protein [Henriciella sp.]
MKIILNNCPSAFAARWAYDQIAWWVQQHDPATGSICGIHNYGIKASIKKVKTGFTVYFEHWEDSAA